MPELIARKLLNQTKYDAIIELSPHGRTFAHSFHLDQAAKGKWNVLVWNDYEAVMPLPFNKKLIISQIYNPILSQQLGVFISPQIQSSEEITRITQLFLAEASKLFKYININLHAQSQIPKEFLPFTKKKGNYIIPLNQNYESIHKSYDRETRRQLRKHAEKHQVQSIDNALVLVDFYYSVFKEKLGLNQKLHNQLVRIINAHLENKTVEVYGTYFGEELTCAVAFLNTHKRLTSILGGPNELGKKTYAMHTVYDYVLRKYAGQATCLDFMGSELKGVAAWMRSMGGQEAPYYQLAINNLPFPLNLIKKLR